MEVLREKGAIENLIPYLEKSDVIGEEDIVDSAYQILTADGGLYMLPTNFVLYTLITKENGAVTKKILPSKKPCGPFGNVKRIL